MSNESTGDSGMPPLPAPDVMFEQLGHEYDAYSRGAMLAYGRQVAQMCAELADEVHEPPHFGHENPHTFEDGRCALVAAIRKRFGLDQSEATHG